MNIHFLQSHAMKNHNIEAREFKIASHLVGQGHNVTVHVMSCAVTGMPEYESRSNVDCFFYKVDDVSAPSSKMRSQDLIHNLSKSTCDILIVKGIGYDIVEDVCNIDFGEKRPRRLAILGGRTVHFTLRLFDVVFLEYEKQGEKIKSVYPDLSCSFVVLPKLIDWPRVEASAGVSKLYDICCVGALKESKNQMALRDLFDKASIAFVGSGPDMEKLRNASEGYPDVKFFGQLNKANVYSVISQSRLMVHPSLYEGMPRVSAESFACGTPFLGLKSTLELAFSDLNFVTLVDQDELVEKVVGMLGDPELLDQLSLSSKSYAKKFLSNEAIFKAVLEGVENSYC